MNCTKFTLPLPFFINFYYYYSTFTLLLSLLVTPLLLYIILTKSQSLKSFKWYILNQSFWCLLFDVIITATKPVLFPPALAVCPIGIIRNGSFHVTAVFMLMFAFTGIINIASIVATLANRYLLIFEKNLPKFLSERYGWGYYALILPFIFIIFIFVGKNFFTYDSSYFYQAAIEYDQCMQSFVDHEPGFLFVEHTNLTKFVILVVLILQIIGTIGVAVMGAIFIYLIKSQKTQTLEKLQRTLTISAVIQLSITVFLFVIPTMICVATMYFGMLHMENIFTTSLCFIASHCIFEFSATLYFVTPYRKGVTEIIRKYFSYFKTIKTVAVSPVTQTDVVLNVKRVVQIL